MQTRHRLVLVVALALAVLAPVTAAWAHHSPQSPNQGQRVAPPQDQDDEQAERVAPPPHQQRVVAIDPNVGRIAPPPPPPPPTGVQGDVTVHEWGVWRIREGHVDHLQDLAGELPAFVHRTGGLAAVMPPPPPPHNGGHWVGGGGGGMVARKPVIFLRATRPTQVTVTVGFRGGAPWLFYPDAAQGTDVGGTPTLTWTGSVQPIGRTAMQAAPQGHFWNTLRTAGGQLFLGAHGSAEKFLFYDGPVDFQPAFRIARQAGGAVITPVAGEHVVWLVSAGQFNRIEIPGDASTAHVTTQGTVAQLRAELLAEALARHLTAAEAASLLDTWNDDLFVEAAARAVYFEPRAQYDAMLPLQVTPTPVDIVRVGMVIQLLQ